MHKDARFRAPVDMDIEQEARWAVEREDCLSRFNAAVAAGKRGVYAPSEAIIATVRASHGDAAADVAGTELRNAIRREGKKK
jgi:hypothetical protein